MHVRSRFIHLFACEWTTITAWKPDLSIKEALSFFSFCFEMFTHLMVSRLLQYRWQWLLLGLESLISTEALLSMHSCWAPRFVKVWDYGHEIECAVTFYDVDKTVSVWVTCVWWCCTQCVVAAQWPSVEWMLMLDTHPVVFRFPGISETYSLVVRQERKFYFNKSSLQRGACRLLIHEARNPLSLPGAVSTQQVKCTCAFDRLNVVFTEHLLQAQESPRDGEDSCRQNGAPSESAF